MSVAVAVVGGGAWGTALAAVARRAGARATLWTRRREVAAAIEAGNGNPRYLPGLALEPGIRATVDLNAAVRDADLLLLAVPAQFLRAVAGAVGIAVRAGVPAVICAKGIEEGTNALMTEVVAEAMGPDRPLAVLSGPTFAAEVVRGLPTAVTLAAADATLGRHVADAIGSRRFRPYICDDPVGAEVGGAVKNVLAIACGIVSGRGLGENARAALITRGLAEMTRLAVALGGRLETMMGLAGLGDLVLTANAMQSRNFSLGDALGRGKRLNEVLASRHDVTEGVATAISLAARSRAAKVEMPICEAVRTVLHEDADIDTAIASLLDRPFRTERPVPY